MRPCDRLIRMHTLLALGACLGASPAPAATAGAPEKLANAALPKYGARASLTVGRGAVKDKTTGPDAVLDGNPHTRCVVTGVPYALRIELPRATRIERLSFAQSDSEKEVAPKDLEIVFDDGGAAVRRTLELSRPVKRKAVWQDVPVSREIRSVKITVLSTYEGAVKWGGLGDVALWTTADLEAQSRAPGYDPAAPVFVHTSPPAAGEAVHARLPEVAKPGEHPRLLFTPAELSAFRAELPKSERGRATLATFLDIAGGYAKAEPKFPSPEDTAANRAGAEHSTLSHRVYGLGFAFGLTGDEKFARAARAILLGYAERYAGYPRHSGRNRADSSKVHFQRLSEAMWLIPQLEGYDFIHGSAALSEADRKLIDEGLVRPAIEEIRRKAPAEEAAGRDHKQADWRTATPELAVQGKYPNWVNFYSAATLMAGVLLHDTNMVDLAAADFRAAVATGIGADGMWGEGAIGYQLFAMTVMAPGFEAAARQGIDLWDACGGRFKQLFDSPMRYAYPDGTMPGLNDSGRARFGSWQTMVYDYGYLRYGDPRYAAVVNGTQRQMHASEGIFAPTRLYEKLPEAASVSYGSTLFQGLGLAILRDDSRYALLKYGPHGGVHGHYDKLNLVLFAGRTGAAGDEMGGEPRFHPYEDPLHGEWTVQTVAHNTMTVDRRSQTAAEGRVLLFEDTPAVKLARAECATAYPGVLLDRTVVVTPDALIDLFHGRGTVEHTWDRTFRYAGRLAPWPAATGAAKPLGEGDGYQHLSVAAEQPAADAWQGAWETPAGKFAVTLAGAPGQRLILATGPDREQMALARQQGTNADFAAVYALDGWGNPVQTARWLSGGAADGSGAAVFETTQQDGATTRVIVAHRPGAWEAAGWKSDARVLYVREKGAEAQWLVAGGTFARQGELELRRPAAGNWLARENGAKLEIVTEWAPKAP